MNDDVEVPGEGTRLEDLVSLTQLNAFAASASHLVGVTVSITNEQGNVLAGAVPPSLRGPRVRVGPPSEERVATTGERYVVGTIERDQRPLGFIVLGPLDLPTGRAKSVAEHLLVTLSLILHAGERALHASNLHVASITTAYQELENKNRDLEIAYARLKELDHLKSSFLATVSHELRTPLTSIIGYSEMLLDGFGGPLNKEQLDFVQTIRAKGDQLLALIMSLLDLTKLESGTLSMRLMTLPIESVLGDAMSTVLPKATKKGVTIRIERAEMSPSIRADPDRLRQVFVNLVDNAVKFTPEGGEVVLSAREIPVDPDAPPMSGGSMRRDIEARVADTGVGIPTHERQRIFDPFYQIDQSSTREQGGAGLGLSIVKRIVEAHGGRIGIEPNDPKGTVFVVQLPMVERPRPSSSSMRAAAPPSRRGDVRGRTDQRARADRVARRALRGRNDPSRRRTVTRDRGRRGRVRITARRRITRVVDRRPGRRDAFRTPLDEPRRRRLPRNHGRPERSGGDGSTADGSPIGSRFAVRAL